MAQVYNHWSKGPNAAEIAARIAAKNLGRKDSEETRLHKSLAAKGKRKSPEHAAKVAAALVGRLVGEETREKLRNQRLGIPLGPRTETHQQHMIQSQRARLGDDRAARRSQEWKVEVNTRDSNTCRRCGKKDLVGLDRIAHHIKGWHEFPELRYDVDNGLTLCSSCHSKEHKK